MYVAGVDSSLPQNLNGEVVGVTADAVDADFFALEVFHPFDLRLGQEAMGQDILDAADKDKIRGALNVGADDSLTASQGDLGIAPQHRRSHRGEEAMCTRSKSKLYFLNSPASLAIQGMDWDMD